MTDVLRNKISKLSIFLYSSIMFYIRQFTRLHLDIAGATIHKTATSGYCKPAPILNQSKIIFTSFSDNHPNKVQKTVYN